MGEGVSVAALWGRIALHNKLLNQRQWEECVEVFRKAGGKTPIDRILVHKGFLQEQHAEVIRRKIKEILDKQAAGAAAVPAAPGTHAAPAARPATVPGGALHAPAAQAAAALRAGAHTQAAPGAKGNGHGETESIPLADGEANPNEEHTWRPSDAEWVETTEKTDPEAAHHYNVEQIPLVSDEELGVSHAAGGTAAPGTPAPAPGPLSDASGAPSGGSKSKIIKIESAPIRGAFQNSVPRLATAPRKPATPGGASGSASGSASGGAGEPLQVEDDSIRVECEVAPLDYDPEAIEILRQGVTLGASDIHLSSGVPPFYRLHGQLVFTELPKLDPARAKRIVLGFMDDIQQQRFLKHHDSDFAFEHPELGRFRVNALEQFRGPDIIFRVIAHKIPSLVELGLPPTLVRFTDWHQGLVLITGPAGSGKSTTAAALIDVINAGRKDHMITVETIEVIHKSKGCNVTQRQVPRDTKSFASALRGALREDPDVIMIGEMRDLETVSLAIRAAETGHLVFGTLQTRSAPRTIDRVIDVFPADQQAQIRTMLSESLRGIISQQLIPRADGKGRVVAVEVLHCNSAVANLIRDSKTYQLGSQMQTGRKAGQKLMDESLMELLEAGVITREAALRACDNPKYFANKKEEGAEVAKAKK